MKSFTISKVIFFLDSVPILVTSACMQHWYNSKDGLILIMEFQTLMYLYQKKKLVQVDCNLQTHQDISFFVYRLDTCKLPALTAITMDNGKFNLLMSVHPLLFPVDSNTPQNCILLIIPVSLHKRCLLALNCLWCCRWCRSLLAELNWSNATVQTEILFADHKNHHRLTESWLQNEDHRVDFQPSVL